MDCFLFIYFILCFYKYGLSDSLEVCSNPLISIPIQTVCSTYNEVPGEAINLAAQNARKPFGGPLSSLQRSPEPQADGGGGWLPLPQEPHPAVGRSGLDLRDFGHRLSCSQLEKCTLSVPPLGSGWRRPY